MHSPARRHFQRVSAAQAAGTADPSQPQNGEQYELHAAALWEARRTLKAIKSVQAKIAKKHELLPQFDAYITGVLEGGNGAQDDVLMTVLVWRIDTGDLAGALDIAEYAMKHDLQTPDRYERDTASLIAEEIADQALRMLGEEGADAPALVDLLERADALVADHDMHDEIRAKLHKSLGYAYRDAGRPDDALEQLQAALALNERAGVKKDIERLEREIKNANDQGNA
ncbi:phage terminase small subunit [Modicisalibacter sp. MOD 31.J]|uniref:phage terminase small subunit n=1 Tax=Modicisalibacter sp. MOD 31.J TaxID=2831897 RepID=UPI001CCBB13B|nr:phage terminase small subunit [Modicisalibacter sp. MOD 31.J]MBZ9576717.1 terminase [Modicisalibacter sp. MOD 31.J]